MPTNFQFQGSNSYHSISCSKVVSCLYDGGYFCNPGWRQHPAVLPCLCSLQGYKWREGSRGSSGEAVAEQIMGEAVQKQAVGRSRSLTPVSCSPHCPPCCSVSSHHLFPDPLCLPPIPHNLGTCLNPFLSIYLLKREILTLTGGLLSI